MFPRTLTVLSVGALAFGLVSAISGCGSSASSTGSSTGGSGGASGVSGAGGSGGSAANGGTAGASGSSTGGTAGAAGSSGTAGAAGTGGSSTGGSGGSAGCQDGDTQPCYTGPTGTQGVGACKDGTQTCSAGVFGVCTGDVTPGTETCDGIDNNCDGAVDEGLGDQMCGVGACIATMPNCANGMPVLCVAGEPVPEICDGVDNNCDGQIDESDPNAGSACDSGLFGACKDGTLQCQSGALNCVQNLMPSTEVCDSVDNNCDGTVDNGIAGVGAACSTGLSGVCLPGTTICDGANVVCSQTTASSAEVCDGLDNDCNGTVDDGGMTPGVLCPAKQVCAGSQGCVSLCAAAAMNPSSVGCSFFALNMDNYDETHADAVLIGNQSLTETATVNFYSSYNGVEALLQGNVQVPPLTEYTFNLPNGAVDYIHGISKLRTGGSFRIESDVPIIAYQQSPLTPYYTNDASVLLPEEALGRHYFVASYYDALGGYPSYFDVVATTNGTTVTVNVPNPTAGGTGVAAMGAAGTQTFNMNRYDTLHVVNATGGTTAASDVTGTEITASAPVSVFGGVECAQIPAGYTYCDHIEEQSVPSRNWGQTYVAAHTPKRSNTERYYWRVMASFDNTVINSTPAQTGFPVTLNKGQFYEFYSQADATPGGGSFVLTSTLPFAAIQYMTGQDAFGAGTGDPAMITTVPVEQFLKRYVVLSPAGYSVSYLQVVRTTATPVTLDGTVIPDSAYYTIGAYTVADMPVAAGPHTLISDSPFGIVGTGYTYATSYGYPGGMALNNIAPF